MGDKSAVKTGHADYPWAVASRADDSSGDVFAGEQYLFGLSDCTGLHCRYGSDWNVCSV